MVSHPIKNIARKSEGAIVFTNSDIQTTPFLYNRSLYIKARVNELKVKHALVNKMALVNLINIPIGIYSATKTIKEVLVKLIITLISFVATPVKTTDYIIVKLKVGPIRSPTQFHVIEAKTSYYLLSGREWIHAHNCVPSSLH